MQTEAIILIIITSLTCLTSMVTPIITAFIEFTRRIERSNCFGSSIELTKYEDIKKELVETKSKQDLLHQAKMDELKKMEELIKSLQDSKITV